MDHLSVSGRDSYLLPRLLFVVEIGLHTRLKQARIQSEGE